MARLIHLAAALLIAGTAQAQSPLICPGGDRVIAPDPGLATRVCDTLTLALPQLAACHLPHDRPLTVEVTDALRGPHPDCMGVYDCQADRIAVLPPATLATLFAPDATYARIDPALLFDSVVVHEATHALIYHRMGPNSGPGAQNEYMAYAMQYAFLPDAARDRLLAGNMTDGAVTLDSMNGVILAMSPPHFAARVWQHFSAPGNGCALFQRLVSGQVRFGDGPHP